MSDLYSAAFDFGRLSLGTVSGANAAVFGGAATGNLGFTSGMYMHGDVAFAGGVDGVAVERFMLALDTTIAGLTALFDPATARYALAAAGAFTVTWTGAQGTAMRDILGFEANLSGTNLYTSTKRPKYLIVSVVNGQSQDTNTYEPSGRVSYAEADDGSAYSTAPDALPRYRDWRQPFETPTPPTDAAWVASTSVGGAPVRIADIGSATKVTWSWEHFYQHVRASLPFAVVNRATSGQGEGRLHKMRGEMAHFAPQRVTADYDGHWHMPFATRELGNTTPA